LAVERAGRGSSPLGGGGLRTGGGSVSVETPESPSRHYGGAVETLEPLLETLEWAVETRETGFETLRSLVETLETLVETLAKAVETPGTGL